MVPGRHWQGWGGGAPSWLWSPSAPAPGRSACSGPPAHHMTLHDRHDRHDNGQRKLEATCLTATLWWVSLCSAWNTIPARPQPIWSPCKMTSLLLLSQVKLVTYPTQGFADLCEDIPGILQDSPLSDMWQHVINFLDLVTKLPVEIQMFSIFYKRYIELTDLPSMLAF